MRFRCVFGDVYNSSPVEATTLKFIQTIYWTFHQASSLGLLYDCVPPLQIWMALGADLAFVHVCTYPVTSLGIRDDGHHFPIEVYRKLRRSE